MRPIEQRTDQAFGQALKCVEFRLPVRFGFGPEALQFALGLRYGLVGVAAAHYLLLSSPGCEEQEVLRNLRTYGYLVEDHVRRDVVRRLPHPTDLAYPQRVGQLAREPLMAYIPLYRRLCPLELSVNLVQDDFSQTYKGQIVSQANFFGRRALYRAFQSASWESTAFAMSFFERRQADLEEVREIALLGE